ncbi:MAG: type III-B CRISPR-associated protein Cas10/Cmr2 [Elusimicrobiales bacterium]|nr:type III-B CRISPR-associated protein Cas10/Cmr2 [Elusimicrobiales bacterium]
MDNDQNNNENNQEFWKLKIIAFLHDPANKAFLLSENKSHEDFAKGLIKKLGITDEEITEYWDRVKEADHISAAQDRVVLPKNKSLNFEKEPKLRHPIDSLKYLNLKSLYSSTELKKLSKSLEDIIDDINKVSSNDFKKKFILLWKTLNERLRGKVDEDGMGALWDLMPADTRIPNHSIWHHNRMVSAYASAIDDKSNHSLVLMTIGPVQDFIITARTTADWWAGSYLLSYLSWQGMRVFADELGPDSIIFPDLRGQPLVGRWIKDAYNIKPADEFFDRDVLRPSLPNRWLVVSPTKKAEELAKKAETNIRDEWVRLKNNCGEKLGLEEVFENFSKQDVFLQVYWTVLNIDASDLNKMEKNFENFINLPADFKEFLKSNDRYEKNIGSYFSVFQTSIEKLMGARKSIRFDLQSEERGYKCTMCGKREVVHNDNVNPEIYADIKKCWKELGERINKEYPLAIKDGEMLCSVCLTKRMLGKAPNNILGFGEKFIYPSLTEIAVSDFKEKVIQSAKSNEELRNIITDFCANIDEKYFTNCLPKLKSMVDNDNNLEKFVKIDGSLLFEETYDNKEYKDIKDKKNSLKKLFNNVKALNIPKPSPYLGFIYFDGDKMGEWISQTHKKVPKLTDILHPDISNLPEIKNHFNDLMDKVPPYGPAMQSSISSILLDFSIYVVRYIVETENLGKLVYSGGDDVLAICPLSETLKIAMRIRKAFSKSGVIINHSKVEFEENNNYKDANKQVYLSMGESATGSAGISIAHYHNALFDSLKNARIAEHYAKETMGRDSFAISLLKRSGEHSIFGAKWYLIEEGQKICIINIINEIKNWLSDGTLSNSFIIQLYDEIDTYWSLPERKEIIHRRAEYLAARHIHISNKEENKEEKTKKVNCLVKKIEMLIDATKIKIKEDKYLENLENFKGILSLILFLYRYSNITDINKN